MDSKAPLHGRGIRCGRPIAIGVAIAAALAALPVHAGGIASAADRRMQAVEAALPVAHAPHGGPTVVVTNCDDSGPGSLRDAYFNAVDGETIDLSQLTCSTITLTSGALTDSPSASYVTLNGTDKYSTVIDGNHNGRVLVHNGSGTLELRNLGVVNGSYSGVYGGGCIYAYGNVNTIGVMVSSCSMSSSGTARAYGGAIYAHGYVDLVLSKVSDSSAHAASANSGGGGVWANSVSVSASTISGNTVSGDGSHYARGGGFMSLTDTTVKYSTISGNQAETGGGAFLLGAATYTMAIVDSTISGNHAGGAAGGVYAKYRPLAISNSTIAQNTAGFEFGAGVYLASDTEIESTIIANNTSQDGLYASDVGGSSSISITGANNLIRASTLPLPSDTITLDPMLGPLADNGGLTMTQALMTGSPAIDAGNNVAGLSYDQRVVQTSLYGSRFERQVGPAPDIGAFEFGAPDHIFVNGFEGPQPIIAGNAPN